MPPWTADQAFQIAVNHHQQGRLAEAEGHYRQVLAVEPNHGGALNMLGVLAGEAGATQAGEELLRRSVAVAPQEAGYHFNLARFLAAAGKFAEAIPVFREALRLRPEPVWFVDLGLAFRGVGRSDLERQAYEQALTLNPKISQAWNNLGSLLLGQNDLNSAAHCLGQALMLNPNYFQAMANLGTVCLLRHDAIAAVEWFEKALTFYPDNAEIHFKKGVALERLGRVEEAMVAYRRVLQMMPEDPAAYNNIANLLKSQGRHEEAIAGYRESLRISPDSAETLSNLATILQLCGDHEEAMAHHRKAVALAPDHPLIHGNLLNGALFDPAQDARAISEEHARWHQRHGKPLEAAHQPHANDRSPERRLRIGWVSPDFRDHVVGRNIMPLFLKRDPNVYESICYSMVTAPDAMTSQFRVLADTWVDVTSMHDEQMATRIRADRIDILVDLSLHMAGNRLMVFARKPAPVQVTFAGYPGTTGLRAMDYRLTDPYLDPPGINDALNAEKSIRLPHSFWCYMPPPLAENVAGLPADGGPGITFGCLNNFCKANAGMVALWSRILAGAPESRLLLLSPEGAHRGRMLENFGRHGIAPGRIEFLAYRPPAEYLRAYHRIDIGLDTVPYNGHTTSLDAMWMGVPLVTLVGETVAGRAGLSQLTNLGLPELIAQTPDEYVAIAAGLAQDFPRLRGYRSTLRGQMERSPLMDAGGWTRDIEAAFRAMWRDWCETTSAAPPRSA